jgi:intein-encoded DNA endonuclease-like protein
MPLDKNKIYDLYHKKKLTLQEIANYFKIGRKKLTTFMKKTGISIRNKSEAVKLWRSKRKDYIPRYYPNLNPSKDLAYILGVIKGDGSVMLRDYVIKLTVKDKVFAESFLRSLNNIGLNSHMSIYKHKKKIYYQVRAFSKNFYLWYKNLKLEEIIKGFESDFLRGFYESEGSCCKKIYLIITNTDKLLINLILSILTKFNILHKVYVRKTLTSKKIVYDIYIKDREKFLDFISPCIKNI